MSTRRSERQQSMLLHGASRQTRSMEPANAGPLLEIPMSDAVSFRGIPRTSEEWAALAKVASGQMDVSKDELRRLFMLGLVDRQLGRIGLSRHGRQTLGLGDGSFNRRLSASIGG